VDRTAYLVAEHFVDQLVLLDATEALKSFGHDLGAEVVSASGCVLHGNVGPRQGLLYALSKFLFSRHGVVSEYRRERRYNLGRWSNSPT
jgi:hypothetical protein